MGIIHLITLMIYVMISIIAFLIDFYQTYGQTKTAGKEESKMIWYEMAFRAIVQFILLIIIIYLNIILWKVFNEHYQYGNLTDSTQITSYVM